MIRAYDEPAVREYELGWSVPGPGGGHVSFRCHGNRVSVVEVRIFAEAGVALVHVDDLPAVGRGRIELRGAGIWFELVELDPGRQIQIGLEAHGVTVASLPEDLTEVRGHPVALGLDLEIYRDAGGTVAVGRVLIDDLEIEIDAPAEWR